MATSSLDPVTSPYAEFLRSTPNPEPAASYASFERPQTFERAQTQSYAHPEPAASFASFERPESHTKPQPLDAMELNHTMTVAIVDPNPASMRATVEAIGKLNLAAVFCFEYYPSIEVQANSLAQQNYDVLLINIDSNPGEAFAAIENITARCGIGVIAYAATLNPELLTNAMRAGVREFLPMPLNLVEMARAVRRFVPARKMQETGNLYVFLSAKGGAGVTTLAANFAAALAKNTAERTALIDLDLPLGDAALTFGISPHFSTLDAIGKGRELDSSYLTTLLSEDKSGVSVLAAPGTHTKINLGEGAADRLISIARLDFKHTVLDAGAHWSWLAGPIFDNATRIYLVTQAGVPELRNANRVITSCLGEYAGKLDVVMNRSDTKSFGLNDEMIAKALTCKVDWHIPSDYVTVRNHQNEATPLALGASPVSGVINSMARKAAGLAEEPRKKKRFALFG